MLRARCGREDRIAGAVPRKRRIERERGRRRDETRERIDGRPGRFFFCCDGSNFFSLEKLHTLPPLLLFRPPIPFVTPSFALAKPSGVSRSSREVRLRLVCVLHRPISPEAAVQWRRARKQIGKRRERERGTQMLLSPLADSVSALFSLHLLFSPLTPLPPPFTSQLLNCAGQERFREDSVSAFCGVEVEPPAREKERIEERTKKRRRKGSVPQQSGTSHRSKLFFFLFFPLPPREENKNSTARPP